MSHFCVWVIGGDVDTQLEPYSEELRVAPYKVRIKPKEFETMLDYYKLTKDSPEEKIIEKIKDYYGIKTAGRDKKGKKEFYFYSSYNPNSKWDWYEVGGRWEKEIFLKEGGDGVNEAEKKDIDFTTTKYPFAVVKEGVWYESGEMGWWGISTKNKSNKTWKEIVDGLLKETADDETITIVDAHI